MRVAPGIKPMSSRNSRRALSRTSGMNDADLTTVAGAEPARSPSQPSAQCRHSMKSLDVGISCHLSVKRSVFDSVLGELQCQAGVRHISVG